MKNKDRDILDEPEIFLNKPVHSDFLIHWTGDDIDARYNKFKEHERWYLEDSSRTEKEEALEYLERLKYILKHGLWMIERRGEEIIKVNRKEFNKPRLPRTCFTELKLSEARKHAKEFGRLGIGVKRYYLFNRRGMPMFYVQEGTKNLFFPPYSDFLKDESELLMFAKHMCPEGKTPKRYTYYDESEWRIILTDKIKGEFENKYVGNRKQSVFTSIEDINDNDFKKYLEKVEEKFLPKYLLPLDKWFSIIIYPSLLVKVMAERDKEIQRLIKEMNHYSELNYDDVSKETKRLYEMYETKPGCLENYSLPIQMDLDACRNF